MSNDVQRVATSTEAGPPHTTPLPSRRSVGRIESVRGLPCRRSAGIGCRELGHSVRCTVFGCVGIPSGPYHQLSTIDKEQSYVTCNSTVAYANRPNPDLISTYSRPISSISSRPSNPDHPIGLCDDRDCRIGRKPVPKSAEKGIDRGPCTCHYVCIEHDEPNE